MEINSQRIASQERVVKAAQAWPMLGLMSLLGAISVAGIFYGAQLRSAAITISSIVLIPVTAILLGGLRKPASASMKRV